MLLKRSPRSVILKIVAHLTLLAFTSEQILYAADFNLQSETGVYQAVISGDQEVSEDAAVESATEDIWNDFPLSQPTDGDESAQAYELERYSVEEALELLRPEYASAVILKELNQESLQILLDLPFEVGILVLHGEIVLFTSGSADEIGTLSAAGNLLEKASFLSHTHPGVFSREGPSGQDLNEAVSEEEREYVISRQGVYAYNAGGVLNEAKPYSYADYLEALNQALEATRAEQDQVEARKELNQFIAEQDRYNEASEPEQEILWGGGTLSNTSGLSASKVTALPGKPYPYVTSGSTEETFLAFNSQTTRFVLGYSVPGESDSSGFTISFDNASTTLIETRDLSTLSSLVFGLQGPNPSVRLEIVDVNGVSDFFTLTNIASGSERFWKIAVSAISSLLDKTKIKQINFIVTQANTVPEAQTGTLYIRTYGVNTNPPAQPVVTSSPPALTNQTTVTLSGTKEANTAILVNGALALPLNGSTTWSVTLNLTVEGKNSFEIRAETFLGKISSGTTFSIKRDTAAPTGFFTVNAGALYTASQTVTLKLSATDSSSGISKASFSADCTNWTGPESYTSTKTVMVPSGDGAKKVCVKFYDAAGNVSAAYSKSITLDQTPPTGEMVINSGAAYTRSTTVSLSLSAADPLSGIDKMSFSFDGKSWTSLKTFQSTQLLTLPSGDGQKTVYVKFYDKAGNASAAFSKSILLDRTGPSGSININSGVIYTDSPRVTLNLSGSDSVSGVDRMSFSVDNVNWSTPEVYQAAKSFTLSSGDGKKTVYVKYFDRAGNVSTVYSKTITLDTRPSAGEITINGGAAFVTQRLVSLTISTTNESIQAVEMRFSNNGTDWSSSDPVSPAKEWTLTSGDGIKTVYVKFADASGNWSRPSWATIIFDTTPPKGSLNINSGATYTSSPTVQLNLSAIDLGGGVSQVSFSTDNLNWSAPEAYESSKAFSLPSGDGLKTVYVKYYDRVGNVSVVSSKAIALDTAAPSGSIVINNGDPSTTSREVTLSLTASDSVSGVEMRFSTDGGESWTSWEAFRTARAVSLPRQGGLKEVQYQIRDKAGNVQTLFATILYNPILPDGTKLLYDGNTLLREEIPGGYETFYRPDGSVDRFRYPDGVEIRYSATAPYGIEILSSTGDLNETIDRPSAPILNESQALRVTLQDGTETFYAEGNLVEIRTPGGVRVTNFTLTPDNQFENALMTYPDGTREVIRRGVLLRRIYPDGTVLDFLPTGFPVREILADYTQYFSFDKLSQTQVAGTRIFTSTGTFSLYDELGILREVLGTTGEHFIYVREEAAESFVTHLDLNVSTAPGEQTLVSAAYTKTGVLLQITLQDGTVLFFEGGRLDRVLDSSGNEVDYAYLIDQEVIKALEVFREGASFLYDETGFLSEITTEGGTIHRLAEDTNGDGSLADEEGVELLLETVGGNRLTDFELDSEGNIVRGVIETREGIKQTIENSVLTGFETVDGRIYDYAANQAILREWHFRDGTRVIYGGGTISEVLFPDGKRLHTIGFNQKREINSFIEELPDGTSKYFEEGRLVWLRTPEGTELYYNREGVAYKAILPDFSEELITYHYDEQGDLLEVVFEGGFSRRVFTPDGTLTNVLTSGVNAAIANGEVASLFTRFGSVQAPQFDENGVLSGAIDFVDGTRQVLKNGVLVQTILPSGTKVNYVDGVIDSIEVLGEGGEVRRYELVYETDADGNVTSARIRRAFEEGAPEYPLIPYLLDPITTLLGPAPFDDDVAYVEDAKIVETGSKFGGGSAAFDGSQDYINVADSEAWDFGTGDFTIDFWTKFAETGTSEALLAPPDNVQWIEIHKDNATSTGLVVRIMGTVYTFGPWAPSANQWYHVAVVRSGTELKVFINGTQVGTTKTDSSNISMSGDSIYLGRWPADTLTLNGGLDEFRISKGIARWTSNFTPPTQEYERDAHTQLLLHFMPPNYERPMPVIDTEVAEILLARPLYDAFSNTAEIQSEFETGDSIYFAKLVGDLERGPAFSFGSDYLAEWESLYPSISKSDKGYITRHITRDVVDHLPAMMADLIDMNGDGLKDRVFVDATANVGYWWVQYNTGQGFAAPVRWGGVDQRPDPSVSGYNHTMGSLRYYEGRHPHILGNLIDINGDGRPDRVTQKFDGSAMWYVQLNNGSGFDPINESYRKKVTAAGDTELDTDQSVFGGTSAFFDGTGDTLKVVDDPDWDIDRKDFTIELNVRFKTLTNAVFLEVGNGDSNGIYLRYDQSNKRIEVRLVGGTEKRFSWTPSADTWYHVALVRSNGYLSVYINGNQIGQSQLDANNIMAWDKGGVTIGGHVTNSNYLNGWMDEVRISMGIARYTSNFNPSDQPFVADKETALLLHLDGEDATSYFRDDARELDGYSNLHVTSQWSFQAEYAQQVRNDQSNKGVQELIADLVDMDGDGLADRVIRPWDPPYNHWFFQKNTGSGFADAVLWEGVDASFYPGDEKMGGSLSWYGTPGNFVTDLSDLIDLNGDKRPDRVLLKRIDASDPNSAFEWWVQFNNGEGFEPPVKWDPEVRLLPNAPDAGAGTALRAFKNFEAPRNLFVDLRDVTGDGLVDRVTLDQNVNAAQNTWWVEVNTGKACGEGATEPCGFQPAVAWTGIYGTNLDETAISQDNRNFRSTSTGDRLPTYLKRVSDLTDINGDGILDRVIFPEGSTHWLVQFGTGSGFTPVEELTVESLTASTDAIRSSRYDFVHISLKAESPISSADGQIRIVLEDPNVPEARQEWTVTDLGTDWKDLYLPIDRTKPNAGEIKVIFEPTGVSPSVPIYVDNVTFTAIRPPAAKDWLDRFLAEENILAEIHSERTETLASYLGLREAMNAPAFDWQKLLNAETRIEFDATGEAVEFETLYGSISQVQDGRVIETVLPDGTRIAFSAPTEADPQRTTQTVIGPDGTIQTFELAYGRIRTVSRPTGSPLQYSYEFDAEGREITVVFDPDTGMTERYSENRLIARSDADGVVTIFEYNEHGELIRTYITYKGRVRETLEIQATGSGNRIVTTDEGIVEEYSPEGKIIFHTTPEGYRYAHTFERSRRVVTEVQLESIELPDGEIVTLEVPVVTLVDDPEGEELHRVTLIGYTTTSGEYAGYENSFLATLRLADGTKIYFDRIETQEVTDPATGNSHFETNLLDAMVYHPDGTITEFRDGKPFAITTATGRVIALETEDGLLINPNESAAFHWAEAQKLWNQVVNAKWVEFQLAKTLPIQMEYTLEGKLVTRTSAEGTVELYEDGKIQEVLARSGERLVHYLYDEEGNIIHIDQEGARRRLETAVLKLKAEVAVEREEALARLAEREAVLDQTIEGQYQVVRDRLRRIRSQLEEKRASIASLPARGSVGKSMISNALGTIDGAISQVNQALHKLAKQRAEALAELHQSVLDLKTQIDTETEETYRKIDEEHEKAKKEILRQEIGPVVHHWYRKILGRDPNREEFEAALAQADYATGEFDLEGLKAGLLASPELAERQAQVSAIRAQVRAEIEGFLALSDAEKLAFAQSLGILSGELVPLSSAEVTKILEWLDTRSLHFGQSAYLALEALLDNAGVPHERVELATRLIVVDIVTGILTPLEEGDLILSLYSMKRVAQSYGLEAYSIKLTYDVLKAMYEEACPAGDPAVPCDFRLVAHIDSNHYIIITYVGLVEVKDEEGNLVLKEGVKYIDPGAGPEGALEALTLTKEAFLKVWVDPANPNAGFGFALSPRPPPQASLERGEAQLLTAEEEMRVRGSFFFVFIIYFIVAAAVLFAIAAITGHIDTLLGALKSILVGWGNFYAGLFTGDFSKAWRGIKEVMSGELAILGFALAAPVLLFAKGLEFLGVSPRVTDTIIASVKIAVGVVAIAFGVATVNPAAIGLGLSLIGGGTADLLRLHTDLNPAVIQMISIGAQVVGAFVGGSIGGDFSFAAGLATLKDQLPYLAKEFATAGVTALGSALGLDPRITGLISIPVSAAVGNLTNSLVNPNGGGGPGATITQLEVGLQTAPQEFTWNVEGTYGEIHLDGSQFLTESIDQPSLWDRFFSFVKDAAISSINFVGGTVQNLASGVIDLGREILDNGLVNSLQKFATQIFDRETIESIYNSLGGIQGILDRVGEQIELPTGSIANAYAFSGTTSLLFDNTQNLIGQIHDGRYELGDFSLSQNGEFFIRDGVIIEEIDGYRVETTLVDGKVTEITIQDPAGEPMVNIEGTDQPIFIEGPDDTKFLIDVYDAIITLAKNSAFGFTNGILRTITQLNITVERTTDLGEVNPPSHTYVLNGINNPNPPGVVPDYVNRLIEELSQFGVIDATGIALFEGTTIGSGSALFLGDSFLTLTFSQLSPNIGKIYNTIANDIASGIIKVGDTINMIAHSGAGQAVLAAASELFRAFGIKLNVVLYGSPVFWPILSSNILNMQVLVGSDDELMDLIDKSTYPLYPAQFFIRGGLYMQRTLQGMHHVFEPTYHSEQPYFSTELSYIQYLAKTIADFLTTR